MFDRRLHSFALLLALLVLFVGIPNGKLTHTESPTESPTSNPFDTQCKLYDYDPAFRLI
jgi:hypothetical protein